jgi:hypothetical protein
MDQSNIPEIRSNMHPTIVDGVSLKFHFNFSGFQGYLFELAQSLKLHSINKLHLCLIKTKGKLESLLVLKSIHHEPTVYVPGLSMRAKS